MNKEILFLGGCIPARLLIALCAYKINAKYLPYFSIFLFLIGFSFLYLYIFNKRLNAPEAGGKTWWKNLRPIHGTLYIIASIYAFNKNRLSALFLLIDAILGLSFHFLHKYHYM
jgi:hypothetical protein